MTDRPPLAPLPGGPYDLEFFFDPGCPFAWQTSRWIQRVIELRGVRVGWRFISLRFVNEGRDLPDWLTEAQEHSHAHLRVCAAARDTVGNDAVDRLYTAYGERLWHRRQADVEPEERVAANRRAIDVAELLGDLDLPSELADAAGDERWDEVIRAESTEALRRTGPDVGTPIITFDPPNGSSLFGPVISAVPDDETTLALYDALRTMAGFEGFSELKRSKRPPLDLPALVE